MRYAFIFMNDTLPGVERTSVREGQSEFVGVRSLDEACAVARSLVDEGVGCIELCGAFGEDGAREVMEATGRRVPVGYIVQLPELRDVCERAFGRERPSSRMQRDRCKCSTETIVYLCGRPRTFEVDENGNRIILRGHGHRHAGGRGQSHRPIRERRQVEEGELQIRLSRGCG